LKHKPRDGQAAGWRSYGLVVHFMFAKPEKPRIGVLAAAKSPARGAVWRSRGGLRPWLRAGEINRLQNPAVLTFGHKS